MTEHSAKDIRIAPIKSSDANEFMRRSHYSGKVVNNSQLHLGAFLDGRLEGVMQFGPSMDKSKLIGLVTGTKWTGFIELNRMAFSPRLPRNSESRALGVAMRMIRKHYPQTEWVISFADGSQCGDGTIYRAAGFALTGITKNKTLLEFPNGKRIANLVLTAKWDTPQVRELAASLNVEHRPRSLPQWYALGVKMLDGFQLRYMYFTNPAARARLTVPVLPFDAIDEQGAGMYRGERIMRTARRPKQAMAGPTSTAAVTTPTRTLQPSD